MVTRGPQSVTPGPGSSGSTLEMHVLRSDLRTTGSDALGVGPSEQATLGILNHVKLGNPWSGAGALLPGCPLASPLGWGGGVKKHRAPTRTDGIRISGGGRQASGIVSILNFPGEMDGQAVPEH